MFPVKSSQKFKDIKARFNLHGTSTASRIVENMCNIVLLLEATDWFSPIIASKVFLHMILEDCSVNFIA